MDKHIKTKVGTVIRKSSNKTIIVEVERFAMEPEFKKYIRRRKKFHVHDEKNSCQLGDKVRICETRPISKLKSWKISEIVKHGLFVEKGAEDTAKKESTSQQVDKSAS